MSTVIEVEEVEAQSSRFIRLTTIDDVRVEMARVYREMRTNKIAASDGSKLVYVLSLIARTAELVRIENQLEQLRAALEKAGITYVSDT